MTRRRFRALTMAYASYGEWRGGWLARVWRAVRGR